MGEEDSDMGEESLSERLSRPFLACPAYKTEIAEVWSVKERCNILPDFKGQHLEIWIVHGGQVQVWPHQGGLFVQDLGFPQIRWPMN